MDWQLWIALALLVAVLVGMWLYVRAWQRKPTEYELAYENLRKATQEAAETIGAELRPVLMKAADALNDFAKAFTSSSVPDGIVACKHHQDGRLRPCPPQCPQQDWPRSMFKMTLRGSWKLKRRHRSRAGAVVL